MGFEFNIIENPPADSQLWEDWKNLVDSEGWTSDDNSVTLLTPELRSTRSIFATNVEDDSFVGCVVWNEYDNVSFLGFFLLAPEYRGKGCGMKIWHKAIEKMPKDFVLGLRGVPSMADKYRSMNTPVTGPTLENYKLTVRRYREIFHTVDVQTFDSKLVSDFTDEEWQKLLDYDKAVNGRDRTDFLERYYKDLDFTTGMVLLDTDRNIIAHVSSVTTSGLDSKVLKISPLYAESESIALSALRQFAEIIYKKYPSFDVIFHILSTERGEVVASVFRDHDITASISGLTLYSKECPKYGDESKVYIAHNNSCHYDY